jgi:hypothetical protein
MYQLETATLQNKSVLTILVASLAVDLWSIAPIAVQNDLRWERGANLYQKSWCCWLLDKQLNGCQ